MNKFGTGCIVAPKDDRDYLFSNLLTTANSEKYPDEYIPELDIVPFDQGVTNMCCACAVAMSRYITEKEDSKTDKLFSPAYIYGNRCKSVFSKDIYEGEGMYLKDALKQLINMGDCFYETLPGFGTYSEMKDLYQNGNVNADMEAYPYRVSSYYSVRTTGEIKKAIIETGSVLASYNITDGWYNTESNGIIPTSGCSEGGHAVLIVGWKNIKNKQYWIILNSWGEKWGDHGFGYIDSTIDPMEAYCILDNVHENQITRATSIQKKAFINKIAPLAQKAYKQFGKPLPSVCIAMAAVESGWGTAGSCKYNSYMGQKVGTGKTATKYWSGNYFNSRTQEVVNQSTGQLVTIKDNFRAYDSVEQCIFNYYELLNTSLYKRVLAGSPYNDQMQQIKVCGYMTSVTEVNTCISIIKNNNLTQYDGESTSIRPTIKYGNRGTDVTYLQQRLIAKGYGVGKIDGIFGKKTLEAVKAFQAENGLVVDGIVGVKTWNALQ